MGGLLSDSSLISPICCEASRLPIYSTNNQVQKVNMKNIFYLFSLILFLGACTTPATMLKNDDTGQIVSCGGNTSSSVMLGAVGYYMQKSSDSDCVANYMDQGFRRIHQDLPSSDNKHDK